MMQLNTSGNDTTSINYRTIAALSVLRCLPMILIGVASFVGNALVLLAIYRYKNLQTFTNAYIGSLAITDVLASFVMPLSYITVLLDGEWIFGAALCQLQGILLTMLATASMLTLLCFSIYRCYVLTTMSKRLSDLKLRKLVKGSVGLIWLLAVTYAIPPLFVEGQVRYLPIYYSCFLDFRNLKYYAEFLFVFLFTFPLIVMLIAYVRIIKFINIHNRTIADTKCAGRQQSQADFVAPSPGPPSDTDDGDHCTVMELKRQLEELENDVDSLDNSEVLNEHEGITQVEGNEAIRMDSLSLTSENGISDKIRSYTLHEMTCDNDKSRSTIQQRLEKVSPSNVIQKWKARAESQKLLRQYTKRVSYQARLARILLATVVAFLVCWTPFIVDTFLLGVGYTKERPKLFPLVAMWFAYTNAICNPIIYAFLNNHFRVAFTKILNGVFHSICVCRQ